jgi:hypothetical protein
MSSAALSAATRPAWTSTTVRQFGRAVVLTGAALGVGCLAYGVETVLLRSPRRFVENPSDVVMRALGLAHFLIGWLFLATSPRLRSPAAVTRLFGWTALGAGLCVGLAWGGGLRNPFLLLLFYGYFLVHEVRDQAHLFRLYGDAPDDSGTERRFLTLMSTAVALLLTAVLVAVYLCHGNAIERTRALVAAPAAWLLGLVALFAVAGAALLALAFRGAGKHPGGAAELLRAHRPLLLVYGGILAVLVVGGVLGSVGFNLIILVHVMTWLVFVHHQLRRKPAAGRLTWWGWLRSTPVGFVTLHVAVALVVFALMGLRVYAWERSGWASALLARSSFAYWSVLHITTAFWRGR